MTTTTSRLSSRKATANTQPRLRYRDQVYFQDGLWLTALLAILLFLLVATSLDAAGYVERMALLVPVTLGASALALLTSYSRFDGFFAFSHSLFTGLALILFLMTGLVEDRDIAPFLDNGIPALQAKAYFVLLQWLNWVDAALNNQANEDNFVFIFEIAFLVWWLTYLGIWSIFRYGYTWRAIIPAGIVLVINTYYAPEGVVGFLVVFSLVALVLMVRTNLSEQQRRWRENAVYFSPDITLDFMRNALIFATLVLAVAWVAPSLGRNLQVREALSPISDRWQETAENWNRLYGGLNRQARPSISTFGRSLNLGGERNVGNNPVFQVQAASARYWRAVVYDTFTGRQWLNTVELEADFGVDENIPIAGWTLREPISQTITLLAPTGNVVFSPPDIRRTDLPITALVQGLSAVPALDGPAVEELVELPAPLEFSLVRSDRQLEVGDSYTVVSNYIAVTERALDSAGVVYPPDIAERYLQLPENFSPRVAELAQSVAGEAPTPYAMTKAVESYLRTIPYNEAIAAPPEEVDPMEYFLFEIREGYCDYYATAMVVMLRSLGIPARAASGYAEGTYDDESRLFIVTEQDAHTWVEVYFPGLGWVEFEPTAAESELVRPRGEDPDLGDEEPSSGAPERDNDLRPEDDPLMNPLDPGQQNIPQDDLLFEGATEQGQQRWRWIWALLIPVVLLVGGWMLYRAQTFGPNAFAPDLAPILFERMQRWARRLGVQSAQMETPYEQARRLQRALPPGKKYIDDITEEYVYFSFSGGRLRSQPAASAGAPADLTADAPAPVLRSWNKLRPLMVKAWLRKFFVTKVRRKQNPYALTRQPPPQQR